MLLAEAMSSFRVTPRTEEDCDEAKSKVMGPPLPDTIRDAFSDRTGHTLEQLTLIIRTGTYGEICNTTHVLQIRADEVEQTNAKERMHVWKTWAKA